MRNGQETLVILTPGFAASEADSTCLPMQQHFVQTLKKVYPGLNIIIVSFQYPYHRISYDWFGVNIIPFDGRNKGGLARLYLRQKIYARLKRLSQTNNIIGLLSFWYGECALVGSRFGRKNHIRHCCWLLGQDARNLNKYPARVSPDPDELVALSDFLQAEFYRNHGVKPFAVIPPGIPINDWADAEKDIDLLAAGSLIALKQFHIFLEIVAEIKGILPSVKAVLIGEGPEMAQLQNLTEKLGLENNVSLVGKLAYPEVLLLMRRAKVFLHPSSYEGFSGVCQEALSRGAHVISFVKAMHQEIEQWHIVNSKKEMLEKAIEILQDERMVFKRIVPYTMENAVKKMMIMFGL